MRAEEKEEREREKKKRRKARREEVATHRNPNRVISSSLFLDGSREPKNTG